MEMTVRRSLFLLALIVFGMLELSCKKKAAEESLAPVEEVVPTPTPNPTPTPTPTPAPTLTAPTIQKHAFEPSAMGAAVVEFIATDAAHASFECSLDGAAYAACSSPFSTTGLAFGTHSLSVRSLDANGNTGVAASSGWLVSDQLKAFDLAGGTSNEKLTIGGVAIDSNGIMYLGTYAGPRKSTDGGQTFTTVTTGLTSGFRTWRIRVGSDNKVYAALESGVGISTDQGANWTKYTTTEGLGHNAVSDVYVDSSGKVYAATGAGLSIKASGSSTFTNYTAGLPAADCSAVTKDDTGRLLVATGSGLARASAAAETSFSTLLAGSVTSVSAFGQKIIVNTSNNGVKISTNDGSTWTTKNDTHGLPSKYVYSVLVDSRGYFYAATSDGFAYSIDNGTTWKSYGTGDGLSYFNVYHLNTDSWGRLLIGSQSGFSMTHFTGSTSIPLASSDLSPPVLTSPNISSAGLKSYKVDLSWTKATDAETGDANIDYALVYSSEDYETVEDAFARGTMYQGKYFRDINSLSASLVPGSDLYYAIVARNASGAKSIFDSSRITNPKVIWTQVADLDGTSGAVNLWYGAAVSFANKLWMLAGMEGTTTTLTNKSWSSADNGATWSGAAGTGSFNFRYGHVAASFGGKIWLMGGAGGASSVAADPLNSILSSTDGSSWTTEVAEAPWVSGGVGRIHSALLVHGDKLIHIGGEANTSSTTKYADVYSSTDGVNWNSETGNLTGSSGLSEFSAVSFRGKIFVINDSNVYVSATGNSWANLGAHGIPGTQHLVRVVNNSMMCLFGGSDAGSGYLDYTTCSVDGKTWTQASDAHPFETKIGDYGMAAEHGGTVYYMMGAKYGYPKKVYRLD